jgi:hypothetical protein
VPLHRDGVPFDSAKFGHELRAARRRAGLPESIPFHDPGHFFASTPIHGGCSVKQVQAALDHKSAKSILPSIGHVDELVGALEECIDADVDVELNVDAGRGEPGCVDEGAGRGSGDRLDLGIDHHEPEVGPSPGARTADVELFDRVGIADAGVRQRCGVTQVGAEGDVEQPSGVGDAGGQREHHSVLRVASDAERGDPSVGGLEAVQAAGTSGSTDRASSVARGAEWDDAGTQGGRRPAARNRSNRMSSRVAGPASAHQREPRVVGMPAQSSTSFTPNGVPASGPSSSLARRAASTRSEAASAPALSTWTNAGRGSCAP